MEDRLDEILEEVGAGAQGIRLSGDGHPLLPDRGGAGLRERRLGRALREGDRRVHQVPPGILRRAGLPAGPRSDGPGDEPAQDEGAPRVEARGLPEVRRGVAPGDRARSLRRRPAAEGPDPGEAGEAAGRKRRRRRGDGPAATGRAAAAAGAWRRRRRDAAPALPREFSVDVDGEVFTVKISPLGGGSGEPAPAPPSKQAQAGARSSPGSSPKAPSCAARRD